jgi:hypothetical protein
MGQEDKELFRFYRSRFGQNELVIDGDESPSHPFLSDSDKLTDNHEEGKQKSDYHAPNTTIEEEVFPSNQGKNQRKRAAEQKQDHGPHDNGHDERQIPMDVGKPDIGNKPEDNRSDDQYNTDEEKQKNKYLFLGVEGGI